MCYHLLWYQCRYRRWSHQYRCTSSHSRNRGNPQNLNYQCCLSYFQSLSLTHLNLSYQRCLKQLQKLSLLYQSQKEVSPLF